MDEKLEKRLKQRRLLPLEIDTEMKEFYRKIGIDPSIIETHYDPGTPDHIIKKCERIKENVLKLHRMETIGTTRREKYKTIKAAIEKDLFELDFPTVEDVLRTSSGSNKTGVGGVNRDYICKS